MNDKFFLMLKLSLMLECDKYNDCERKDKLFAHIKTLSASLHCNELKWIIARGQMREVMRKFAFCSVL